MPSYNAYSIWLIYSYREYGRLVPRHIRKDKKSAIHSVSTKIAVVAEDKRALELGADKLAFLNLAERKLNGSVELIESMVEITKQLNDAKEKMYILG